MERWPWRYRDWPYRQPRQWPWRYRVLLQAVGDSWERRVRVRQQNLDLQVQHGTAVLASAFNPILAYVRDHLERLVDPIGPSTVPDDVLRPFENAIWAVRILGDLIGRWHVEMYRPDRMRLQGDGGVGIFILTPGIPFREAIEALLRRRLVPPEVFRNLSDLEKVRAFTIARAAVWIAITRIRDILLKALEEGMTLKQFRDEVLADAIIQSGVSPMEPYYLETVFRTNLFSAYMSGRFRGLQAYADRIAFFRYVTMEDDRVRPTHARMHGFTARPNDPIWSIWWPPNGYNCRCDIEPIWADDPEASRMKPSRVPDVLPDKGFRANPAIEAIPKEMLQRALRYKAFTKEELTRLLNRARTVMQQLEAAGLPESFREVLRKIRTVYWEKMDVSKREKVKSAYKDYYQTTKMGGMEPTEYEETLDAINMYKSEAYKLINAFLSGLERDIPIGLVRDIERLIRAFKRDVAIVRHRYIRTFRGEKYHYFASTQEDALKVLQAIQPGDTFRFPVFMSTSLASHKVLDFALDFTTSIGDVKILWDIRIPQGQRALFIDAVSSLLSREEEVLLPPGTVLRVIGKKFQRRGSITRVILEAEVIDVEWVPGRD